MSPLPLPTHHPFYILVPIHLRNRLSPLPVYHATFAGPETQRGSSSTPVVAIINDRGVLKAKLFGYHLGIYEFKGSGEPAYQRIVLLTDAARVLEEERGIRLMTENTSLSLVW